MADNIITVIGNVTRDPELKFLNSGTASVKFGLAVNKRWQNKQTQEWEEQVSYFDVIAYGPLAENIGQSLHKGYRTIVTGSLEQRSWETEKGEKRTAVEIKADEVGPSLRFNTVDVQSRNPHSQAKRTERAIEDAF